MRGRLSFPGAVTMLALGFLYVPLVLVFANAFNADEDLISWGGFTLEWFDSVLSDPRMRSDFRTSVTIAAATTLLSVTIGVTAALWARRASGRLRAFLDVTTYTRLVLPEIVIAVGLFVLFRRLELPLGTGAIVLGHTVFNSALATVIIQARLATFGTTLEEAAGDLGARPHRVFLRVTLPQLWPAIVVAGLLVFTFSMDDVITSQFLAGGNAETLPMLIMGLIRFQITPTVNAVGVIVMAVTLAAFLLALALVGLRSGAMGMFGGGRQEDADT